MPNPRLAFQDAANQWQSTDESDCLLLQQRAGGDGAFLKAEDTAPAAFASCPWQGWLIEWEERQRLRLVQHEEMTQELVESLRREIMERAGPRFKLMAAKAEEEKCLKTHFSPQVEQQEPALSPAPTHSRDPATFAPTPTQSKAVNCLDMEFQSSNGGVKSSQEGSRAQGETSRPLTCLSGYRSSGNNSYRDLNQAMLSAVGGSKNKQSALATKTFANLESALQTLAVHVSEASNASRASKIERSKFFGWVHHQYFSMVSSFLITLYTVAVGVMADMEMRHTIAYEDVPPWHWYVDFGFTGVFGVEVLLRILASGAHFITGREWCWNIFDVSVACVGLLDVLSVFAVNLGFLRILRTFRAIRVLRVIRVFPIFKELRLMVASITACMVSLAWAFTLLLAVMYIFAVVLLKGSSDYLQNNQGQVQENLRNILAVDFGSLPRTIYSLTQAVSGGRSWGEYAEPFIQISPWYGVCFVLFVVFVIFGVVNILTGLFVESTSAVANFDKELVLQEEMGRNESVINQIRQLFKELDADKSGSLTYQELQKNLGDPRVKAYFSILQMDVSEANGLFQLLDKDESGEVSIEEFIMSCMRLKGAARSIDLAAMLFENKRLYTMMKQFMSSIEELMHDLGEKIALLA